jgi:D-lactate dehydrogenase
MKVCFVSTEVDEKAFFSERLARWEPLFVHRLDDVPADTGVLSIFIHDGIDERFLETHAELELIVTRSSGTDHIDVEACRRHGVEVACGGGSDGNNVAEHTFALLLAVARRLRVSNQQRTTAGDFSHGELRGFELRGKTLGLIGVGRIGARVASLARAFEMKVVACDPEPRARVEGLHYESLDEVLAEAEILSLHAPITRATWHLLDAAAFEKCREGVIIINTARGALIDTEALVRAIESGRVGGVGLDVLEDERVLRAEAKTILSSQIAERVHRAEGSPDARPDDGRRKEIEQLFFNDALLARPEVVFTPHIAFNTTETVEAVCGTVAKYIEDFLVARELA